MICPWASEPKFCLGCQVRIAFTLRLLSVQKTLPIWELHLPRDDAVRHALHLVKDVETGKMACVEAEGFLGGLWKHCDDLMSSGRYAPDVLMVGYAAARVMSVGDSEVLSYTSGATDLEIDSYGHDSFFLAATAYAGGAPWEEASNASKRQEFWAWWLGAVVDAVVER